jgi:D-psicose/D-tagatose/L-ribulose 3-epimerase
MDKIAISNIAWPKDSEDEAVVHAANLGFTGIELVPSRMFVSWPPCDLDLSAVRNNLSYHGLTIVALQSILFGVDGVELFVSTETRTRLAQHLRKVARVAGALGAKACVYGAPRMRDPGSIPSATAFAIAVDFLSAIAPVFESEGSCLCFEANDSSYGCRFVTRTREAIDLVRQIDRPGVRVQIDTGTVFLGREPASIVRDAVGIAGHVHASEPQLSPLGSKGSDHAAVAAALGAAGYGGWISVEMRETPSWRENMERAARLMGNVYRPKRSGKS